MYRFFIPASWIAGGKAVILEPFARQVERVLRLAPGDRIVLLDDTGWEYTLRLDRIRPGQVEGDIVEKHLCESEPKAGVVLYQSIIKATAFEWVLQKGTELGVKGFVPVFASRTVAGREEASPAKVERWRRIIREAAEQSGRCRLPVLEPAVSFDNALQVASRSGVCIFPWESAVSGSLREALAEVRERGGSANILIGPEGGFTSVEAGKAQKYNCKVVTLGRRILRAETAAVVSVGIVLHELGELGDGS